MVGPERPGDEAAPAVDAFGFQRGAAREPGAVAVQFVDELLHAVIGLGDPRRGKGVGLQDIRAGHRIGEMDVLDRLRLGEGEQIVVALQMAFAADEAVAAEVAFFEAEVLDLRPHRAVENEDALARGRGERARDVKLPPRAARRTIALG